MALSENQIGTHILDAAFTVHKNLGPGLLESIYQACLQYELQAKNIHIEFQVPMPVINKDTKMECGFRPDLIVEKKVIVEIKSIEQFHEIHMAQIMTYLKLSGCKLGYLINFNVLFLKMGIKRVIMGKI